MKFPYDKNLMSNEELNQLDYLLTPLAIYEEFSIINLENMQISIIVLDLMNILEVFLVELMIKNKN